MTPKYDTFDEEDPDNVEIPAKTTHQNFVKSKKYVLIWGFCRRLWRWGLGIILIVSLSRYLQFLNLQGDTVALIGEVDRILNCIKIGQWVGWGGQFPLLQKIPAFLLKVTAFSDERILRWLAILSLVAFVHLLAWSWKDLRRRSNKLAIFFVAILLSGPLMWYARSSFGEMLAAFFTLGFVISCRENSSAFKIFFLFVLAGISKDTAFPFLLAMGLLASSLDNTGSDRLQRRFPRWGILVVACLTTAGVNIGFNYLKFGSALNLAYLNPQFIVQTWQDQLSFFLGIWFSPNGGLLFFWPSFCLLIFLTAKSVARDCLSKSAGRLMRLKILLPFIVVMLVLLGLTFGFSKWYAPMGWVCWGPRLLLPWIPASGYLLITAYAKQINKWLSYIHQRVWRLWCVSWTWALVSFAQFVVLFRPSLMNSLFATDDTCPRIAYITQDPAYYYHCIHHGLWTKKSVLLDAYWPGTDPTAFVFSVAWCIWLIWFLGLTQKNEV